jgi:hypothetical protein
MPFHALAAPAHAAAAGEPEPSHGPLHHQAHHRCLEEEASATQQIQQLHIQPLNLAGGLHPAAAEPEQAARSATTNTCDEAAAAAALHSHAAAALLAFSNSTGSLDAMPAPPSAAAALHATSHHELLQALSYAADAAAMGCGASGDFASAGGSSKQALAAAGARKQRFTREQHAAILESVERNYAQYPSRYTELVIKEMQARFPGIELNNACVRKIKFRCVAVSVLEPAAAAVCDCPMAGPMSLLLVVSRLCPKHACCAQRCCN